MGKKGFVACSLSRNGSVDQSGVFCRFLRKSRLLLRFFLGVCENLFVVIQLKGDGHNRDMVLLQEFTLNKQLSLVVKETLPPFRDMELRHTHRYHIPLTKIVFSRIDIFNQRRYNSSVFRVLYNERNGAIALSVVLNKLLFDIRMNYDGECGNIVADCRHIPNRDDDYCQRCDQGFRTVVCAISIPASPLCPSYRICPLELRTTTATRAVILSMISRDIRPSTGARRRPPPDISARNSSDPCRLVSTPEQVFDSGST